MTTAWPRPAPCCLYGLLIWVTYSLKAEIKLRPWRPTFPAGCSVLASPPAEAGRVRRCGPQPGEGASGPADRHRRDASRAVDHHQLIATYVSPWAAWAARACHLPQRRVSLNVFDIAERCFTQHKPGTRRSQETARAFLIMGPDERAPGPAPSWDSDQPPSGAWSRCVALRDECDSEGKARHLYRMLNLFGIAERVS